jgi:parallel beta-helix repeat protein
MILSPKFLRHAFALFAAWCVLAPVFAAPVSLIRNNSLGNSWETGADWSDGQPAGPGKEYRVDDVFSLRTPEDGDPDVFPGDSLTFDTATRNNGIAFKGSDKTITIADLRWGGGRLNLGNNATFTLAGALEVFDGSQGGLLINGQANRSLTIDSLVSGSGRIEIRLDNGSGVCRLTNPGNTWNGELWLVSGTLDLDYAHVQGSSILTADGGTFVLDAGTHEFGPGSTVGGQPLALGTYSALQLNSLSAGGTTFSGPGAIRIGPPVRPRLENFTVDDFTGQAEVTIRGGAGQRFRLVEAEDLDFDHPDRDPIPLTGVTVGLRDGEEVLLDASGRATVQFDFGAAKDISFVRTERVIDQLVLTATGDAWVGDGALANDNFGFDPVLETFHTGGEQQETLLRFDLPAGTQPPDSARIWIQTTASATDPVENAAYLVDAFGWAESTVTWNQRPAAGAELDAWVTSNGRAIQIDVTEAVRAALPAGGAFAVLIRSPHDIGNDGRTVYASREHPTLPAPTLELDFNQPQVVVNPGESVQDALDAIHALGGGRVVLAAGDHPVSTSLEVYSHITLMGEGVGVSRLLLDPAVNMPILIGTSEGVVNRDITIRDLTLNGQQADGERSYPGSFHSNRDAVRAQSFGILFTDTESGNTFERVRIQDVEITRCAMGIHVKGVDDLRILDSEVRGNGCIIGFDHNIYFRRANQTLLKNLDISDCTAGNGFNLSTDCNNLIIDACDASDNTFRGIRFEANDGGRRMMIFNCMADRNGLTENQPGIRVANVPDFKILNTTANGNGSHGILCRFSRDGLLRDNTATGNGAANYSQVGGSNIVLINNLFP